ncbi:mucin-2-like [Stylophora pistillata]|uniref:mucin-2-like n=1 Tax=Stylophora pistillata TaxID=50429 RepID=UPI000C0496EA|nr:mucin-2-like [Stylophora pistillata]
MFKGYIMKLRLNCTRRFSNATEDFCLLFKVKGEVQVPFACLSPSPSTTKRSVPTTKSSTTTGAPSTATCKPTITTTTTPVQPDPPDPAILAAIVVIGTILCLLLIGVFGYFLHQYTILCPCKRR